MDVIKSQEKRFQMKLLSLISHFRLCEDIQNCKAALSSIPIDNLNQIARAKLESCSSSQVDDKEFKDILLLELLTWFKEEFFTWTDQAPCSICSNKSTKLLGYVSPNAQEAYYSASRVESYACESCHGPSSKIEVARFPRYNNPLILLQTRTGRCGEWANCFALICIALNYEVRHVTDWSDHVWVEVFSPAQDRWIHLDPCENKYDMPLLYENGWGKKLSYVIAVSHDDIQDVTMRYVRRKNVQLLIKRRTEVRENWLASTILQLRKDMRKSLNLSEGRLKILEGRLVKELCEFFSPSRDSLKEGEGEGRDSGSLAWRLSRMETTNCSATGGHIWKLDNLLIERFNSKFQLFYDSALDQYFYENPIKEFYGGWSSWAYAVENLFRKEEKDWKMVYLARNENGGDREGKISWKLDASSSGYLIDSVSIDIQGSTFCNSVAINIQIDTSEGETLSSNLNTQDLTQKCYKLKSLAKWIIVSCIISGGIGELAWQKAQVFRNSLNENSTSNRRPFLALNFSKNKSD